MVNKHLLVTAIGLSLATSAFSQSESLPVKDVLPTTLLSAKTYSGAAVSTDMLTQPVVGDAYTIEVKGKFNSGTGRGLDICVNDATATGFRVSMDATSLNWTNPTTQSTVLSSTDNTLERTLRFAVKDKKVNIFEDGYLVSTRPVETIEDARVLKKGENVNPEVVPVKDWGAKKPTPASLGWYLVNNNKEVTNWPNARFENNSKFNIKNADGTIYDGNFFFIRWDSNGYKTFKYTYPVTLEANTTYTFSMDCTFWDNKGATVITTEVYDNRLLTGKALTSHNYPTSDTATGRHKFSSGNMTFTTTKAGTYYIAMSSGWSMYAIKNLQLHKDQVIITPQILLGKAYEGDASVDVSSVTYDGTGAYAPTEKSGESTTLNLKDAGDVEKAYLFNSTVNVSGATSLHLTAATPFTDTKINLSGDDAWLYYDNIKPSNVIANYLQDVTVDGKPAESEANCRVAIYANGTVVIPNGPANDKKAIVVYDGENYTGNSMALDIETYHNNLGKFDNKIRSFKLKKGYMATLANNANGTGYSRVFIANDGDVEMPTMPEGMEFVSFVRAFRWNWTSKKGKANGVREDLNLSCYYDWSAGGKSTVDMEYTPIRQNLGWPGWDEINGKQNVTHLLGCNEPDRPDQANASVDQVMQMWPEMLKSGLRLGSPATSSVYAGWNRDFFQKLDKVGYRCDFTAVHIYEPFSGAGLVGRVNDMSNRANGRPVWITEWNNGANWTGESWPDANRKLTPKNAQKQLEFMQNALSTLNNLNKIERYFEYDWVQDCRAIVLADTLTPAGKFYAAYKAGLAYHNMDRPWEAWKICPPYLVQTIDNDMRNITIKWYDHNGETGKKYILERMMDGETEYKAIKEFTLDKDYKAGETITFTELIPCTTSATYRVKAISYKDTESEYSDVHKFTRDAEAAAPVLKGKAISTTIIKLTWNKVANAKSYRIERADSADGEYKVIADNLTATTFTDDSLNVGTTYYYRAYSINSAATRPVSEVLKISTKSFTVPAAVEGVHISGGSSSVSLRWNFVYDTSYRLERADKQDGKFVIIADKVEENKYVDTTVNNGTTYYYKMQPYNVAGNGTWSAVYTAVPEAGKYLHLAFDENSGNVTYDEWGCNDGTFYNGAAFADGRNGGYAVKLSKGSKSYVELPKGAVSRLSDYTIAAWLNVNGGRGRILDFGSGTGTWVMVAATGAGVKFKIKVNEGSQWDVTIPVTWSKDGFDHLVITQEGSEMAFYFNGKLAGTATNTLGTTLKDLGETKQNWLGRSQCPRDAYSGHVYDDFRIYDRAITADDVKMLYDGKELSFQDSPTGIDNLKVETDNDNNVYNLLGQLVKKGRKGIYVKKGRKFMVK